MHSAFLQRSDGGWSRTENADTVLNHEGELFVNEDSFEEAENLELLAGDQFAEVWGNRVVLTDSVVHRKFDTALAAAQESGSALASHVFYDLAWATVEGQRVAVTVADWRGNDKNAVKLAGFVVTEEEGGNQRLTHNPALAESVTVQVAKNKRRAFLAEQKRGPSAAALRSLAQQCSDALGCGSVRGFRMEAAVAWLLAHDAAFGKRATNKLALNLARRWCLNRKGHKKWLGRWVSNQSCDLLDERFATVCKQGKKPQKAN